MKKLITILTTSIFAMLMAAENIFAYEVGDIIEFGSWPVGIAGEKAQPIEWEILEKKNDDTAIILSSKVIDAKPYNMERKDITWAKSSLRRWLNGEFYSNAFTPKEKDAIVEVRLKNADNNEVYTQAYIDWWKKWGNYFEGDEERYLGKRMNGKGGVDTTDRVWLLSLEDMKRYGRRFSTDASRIGKPMEYLKKKWNFCTSEVCKRNGAVGNAWWWLRSPGVNQTDAAYVYRDGFVAAEGDFVDFGIGGVRAALKINLNNLKSSQTNGGSSVSEFSKPPRLSVGNISYSDSTNSNVLMADGKGNISFTVSNSQAGGTAYNLKALISAKDLSGKALQNVSFPAAKEIGNISPGKSVKVDILITGGDNLASGTAAFTISFAEANGFEPEAKTIQIQTVKLDPPDIQLAEFGLDDTEGELSFGNGNGIVEPGESIVLNLAMLNNGDGIAKGTKITFESGDSEIRFIDNTQFSKGNIQPGGKVSLSTAFSISRRYKGSNTLPIKMKITDERKRFNKEIPLNIALKRSYPKTEIINIASNYKKPQKIKTQTDPLNIIPDAKTQNKYGVAVIIGVRNYENKVPPVLFAINDAQTVRDYVVKALGYNPDNIIYVENPTKGQMEEIFGTDRTHKGRLFNYIKPDRSDVLVYYAGHGAPDQGTKTAFFVPKDANPDYIRIGGYSMETFYANLAKLPAKNITVLTDACFSGQTGDGKMIIKHASPLAVSAKLPGTGNSKISVFNAGRDNEMASWYAEKQHGLFTYYFLLGLGGQADANKDKTITAGELDDYLQENVPYRARRMYNREQHPVFTGNRNAPLATYK